MAVYVAARAEGLPAVCPYCDDACPDLDALVDHLGDVHDLPAKIRAAIV